MKSTSIKKFSKLFSIMTQLHKFQYAQERTELLLPALHKSLGSHIVGLDMDTMSASANLHSNTFHKLQYRKRKEIS